MTAINIQSITGSNFPYTIYACDVYGSQCIFADNDVIRVYGDELPEKGIVKLYELKN